MLATTVIPDIKPNLSIMELLIYLVAVVFGILILRLLGAWMLRINEVISLQKEMIEEIRRLRE